MRPAFFTVTVLLLAGLLAPHGAFAQDYPEGDSAAGVKVFRKCKACHVVGLEPINRVGPHLNNIVGRAIGGIEGFKYSKSLIAFSKENPVWTEPLLDAYLLNPRTLIKGGRMAFAGLRKEKDRRDVIAYMKQAAAE